MRSGNLTYLGRAFSQDAWAAMGGDVVRGLIELITNCDDAYGKANGDIEPPATAAWTPGVPLC